MSAPTQFLDDASAVDVADVLLWSALKRNVATLIVEPLGGEHSVSLVAASGTPVGTRVPSRLGDALAVRLGILAGVDPWAVDSRLGQLKARLGGLAGEYLVIVRKSPLGLGAEARRVGAAEYAISPEDGTLAQLVPEVRDLLQIQPAPSAIGPYHIEKELGRGGMGVVYRAKHSSGRSVALKVLHKEVASDPRLAVQFVREGRAASMAAHPGIVAVTDFGTLEDGRAYLVMDLVEGHSLETELTQGALKPLRAVQVALRIARVLEAAHVRGVIHRDLKPSNVFIGPDDAAKIMDFGSAKIASAFSDPASTLREFVLGTPNYMSPEQAQGRDTDERTDLYALGCLLFRMVTGDVPYRGTTLMQTLFDHVSAPIPAVRSPYEPIPEVLEEAVHKAMAKRPDDRYQTAGEMATALDQVIDLLEADDTRPRRSP
jgi:serine/threonine-protein kinase